MSDERFMRHHYGASGYVPPIEQMKSELLKAGWSPKTPTLWCSPRGKLYYGPAGAWNEMCKEPPDSPLTPWGEQLARVQEMCTEGYGGLSARDKDDIRAVYHRLLDVTREAACPCCHAGTNIEREPCQECKGSGFVSVAYDVLRTRLKLLEQVQLNPEDPK